MYYYNDDKYEIQAEPFFFFRGIDRISFEVLLYCVWLRRQST